MNSSSNQKGTSPLMRFNPGLVLIAALAFAGVAPVQAQQTPQVLPRKSAPYGKSYGEWSAQWWKWGMSLPVQGHPFIDSPGFDVTEGQSGDVWFLGAPFGTVARTCTIPSGKALFLGVVNAEASNLEGLGDTEAEQRATAEFLADHILNPSCTIDGVVVANISSYRVSSPQFTFTAPSPWIFGDTGGTGTSVSDGYFVMLAPLSVGQHTIHLGGALHFAIAEGDPFDFDATVDTTYHLSIR